MDMNGKFYLGHKFNPETGQVGSQPLLYDPADLTTHAVVVGMTGSGKTGLCIDLLEEAALNGLPALMIDPKGDITNTLLHFPDLAPQDFQPWINADEARRAGKSPEQAAAEAAALWREKLSEQGILPERLKALQNAAHFTIYTPGSDAGVPVSILASLKAPLLAWESNRELLREKISGTVTALLGLVGLQDIDPVRSREHILLANIFEHAWSQGRDLDLGELILQTQTPPFPKLGVFDVNTFFPEKERFGLAMALNNMLASPAFQAWIEGQPLDIPALLYGDDGRPRHSVFYIAHLSDAERMFFVTLLFSAVESWMRVQTGTTGLRAIVYFDEIYGYMPPVGNPPAKQPMLRMLKQARAFGVGMVLVTQNPVDIDYKALSNAGTWFIGKLQTEQDKQRLLDGLEGAMPGNLDRGMYDRLISSLGKRVFLLHNVHAPQPVLFRTRWAMNYLAGPLTRVQIPLLNQLASGGVAPTAPTRTEQARSEPAQLSQSSFPPQEAAPLSEFQPIPLEPEVEPAQIETPPASQPSVEASGSTTRPTVPAGVREYFLPNNLSFTHAFKAAGRAFPQEAFQDGLLYRPVILGQASIRFLNRKYNLDFELKRTAIVPQPDRRGMVRWDEFISAGIEPDALDSLPDPRARYAALEAPFTDTRAVAAMGKDFFDWAFRSGKVNVRANEGLKLFAGPNVSSAAFRSLCADAAREAMEAELVKIEAAYDRKIEVIHTKLTREERELAEDQTELSQRKMEEMGTHAENVIGWVSGRRASRRLSSSLTKRRLTEQAKAEVDESVDAMAEYKKQISILAREKAEAVEAVKERWAVLATQVSEISVAAYRKDVLLELFGVAWMPYYIVRTGSQVDEIKGYA